MPLAAGPAEVLGRFRKPLHLRSGNHNLTRRRLAGGKLAPHAALSSCAGCCLCLYRDKLSALGGL